MPLVHARSLSQTVNAIEDAIRTAQPIPESERLQAARWLAARQGLPGSYEAMPAVTDRERREGAQVFTGERMTHASCRHIMGEEACRAIRQLRVNDPAVTAALDRANQTILNALYRYQRGSDNRLGNPAGCFCCGKCSVAVWRHVTAGGLDQPEKRLRAGVASLKNYREDDGRWGLYPFFYTLLALVDMPANIARDELRHAAPACERLVKKNARATLFDRRRVLIAREALAKA